MGIFASVSGDLPVEVVESGVTLVNVFSALFSWHVIKELVHFSLERLEEAFLGAWCEDSLEVANELILEGQVAEKFDG